MTGIRVLRTMSDPKEMSYTLDVMMDLSRVRDGRKALLIVSAGKSVIAYELSCEIADSDDKLQTIVTMLVCEDGELHEHVLICQKGSAVAIVGLEIIQKRVNGLCTRLGLQIYLGGLLGYKAEEIMRFIRSPLGMTCPCDCCGGAQQLMITYQPRKLDRDAFAARTQYYYDPATDA